MEVPVCAVYDRKTGLFDPPFTVRHVGEANREWAILLTDTNTKFGKNPEDFELYQIAVYDDSKGELTTLRPHTQLGG